ncbi:MAG TPA: ribonuclease E/G [Cytophagales bacterium]|nr:ribonuclease E/G [Cytophagales bacterium]HAA23429.1 ribonuclease E/G [Cytophagales bacterium]HAP58624.1 ribonuclease E/G [Cytophagales bacterium]
MSSELIINSTQQGNRIALLKDKRLSEYQIDKDETQFQVGDIYLGTVKKVVPGLNAAFIDIGYEKDAFLHYLDLGPQIRTLNKYSKLVQKSKGAPQKLGTFKKEPDINKLGKINQVLTKNQQILVQVVKEPISTKGPRLSCELSLAGRYMVLVPFSNAVNISKKITNSNERKRLSRLMSSIKPENFGIIIRTVAEGKDVAELDKDLRSLLERWDEGMKALKDAKTRDKVIGEMSRASSMLRDMLNESFDSIIVDDNKMYHEIRHYIASIVPEKEKIVKLHNGKSKVFEQFGIEKQLKMLFGQSVSLPGGGYLVIEHTEALHVIDVNSGNKSNAQTDQETTAVTVNMQAAEEVARQLRLRDMGGIIVIDFIDMKKAEHKKEVYQKMKDAMSIDRSKYTILPLTKFGLMQITRQRVRPELELQTKEVCPTCNGTGKIAPTVGIPDQIDSNLDFILTKQNEKKVTIAVHPFLESYFTKGVMSRRTKWFLKYQRWIKLEKDSSLGINECKFYNGMGEEIKVD